MRRMIACPDCGAPCWPGSARCYSCRVTRTREQRDNRRACDECGKLHGRGRPIDSRLCIACHRRQGAVLRTCLDCGKTIDPRRKRCFECHVIARQRGQIDSGYLRDFNPAAFGEILDHAGWEIRELARRAGLSSSALCRWRSGAARPRITEWGMAAAILALEPCGHCGGTGTIDPTAASIESITRSVRRAGVALPEPMPPLHGAGWTLDRTAWVLNVGQASVPVTRQESRVISTLALSGCSLQIDQISAHLREAGKGPAPHAVHTYLTRLRDKCGSAGVDLGRVIQNSHGHGYRAVMPSTQEVAV